MSLLVDDMTPMNKILLTLVMVASTLVGCGGSGTTGASSGGGGGSTSPTSLSITVPASASAGTNFNLTVTALDSANQIATTYSGTVHFSSSDPSATLPTNSTLLNGAKTFSASLNTAGSQTITVTDTASSSLKATSTVITVAAVATPATHFSVAGPASVVSGSSFNLTVKALDASNNVAPGYSGTVHFTSTDSGAMLPKDSALTNGIQTFSVTLLTAGTQTITATDTSSSALTGVSATIAVASSAFAGVFPVSAFGAKGDGQTDDTAAIQNAINAASIAGGGSVLFTPGRYFTSGTFVVPNGVVLSGSVEGPFDVPAVNPASTTIAPTLLVTNTTAPFITLQGVSSGVTDLLFHYPGQAGASASSPKLFPYTILITSSGTKVARLTVTNAYNFLDIEVGRTMAQDLVISAFNVGVNIDHAADHVTLRNLLHTVLWNAVENAAYPSTIDNWVLSHGIALQVARMDSLEVHDFFVYSRYAGMFLTDSADTGQSIRCGYGTGSNIDLDTVQNGIIAVASNSPGYKFTNVDIGAGPGGQSAAVINSGGSLPPKLEINGGSQRGGWANGAFPSPTVGTLLVVDILP